MSPRVAWRLEGLGFEKVYDYMPGKADWLASGLPKEGKLANIPTLGEAARRNVPTCGLRDRVGDARERAPRVGCRNRDEGWTHHGPPQRAGWEVG